MNVRAFADPLLGLAGPPVELPRPERATLADLIALVPLANEALRPHLRARLGGEIIDPALYHRVLPRADAFVTIVLPVQGGKNGILGTLAVVALVGASIFVSAGGLGFLGSAFAQGALGANLVAGGLSLAGTLLLQGLNAPQLQNGNTDDREQVGAASAQNSFEPGAYLPRVIGRLRVAPPIIMPPYSYFSGSDQYVAVAYGLAGPHALSEVRIGTTKVEEDANIQLILREGFATDTPIAELTDTVIEVPVGVAMSDFVHKGDEEASIKLDTAAPVYVPQWHRLETKRSPNEVVVNFSLSGGLYHISPDNPDLAEDIAAVTALRMRMRAVGASSWINLPEFVLRGRRGLDAIRLAVRFIWCPVGEIPSIAAWTANWRGFSWKYNTVAADSWAADSYFSADVVEQSDSQHVTVYLDEAVFPQGTYEIEAIRGSTVHSYVYNSGTHQVGDGSSGTPILGSFFIYNTSGPDLRLARSVNRYQRQLAIVSVQSVFYEAPFDFSTQPTAVLFIIARNRSVEQVTVKAAGYTEDWDGANWVPDQLTRNPASWHREALRSDLNAEPVPASLAPDEELQDWHEWCTREGLEVNAEIRGLPVDQVLSITAQAGMARPRYGATYGVVIDRPRDPVHLITQRTGGGFSFSKPLGRLPHALKVNLRDEARDYEVREIIVYADGYNADGSDGLIEATRFESITYQGITNEPQARRRARRDLRFARHRSRLINFNTDIEHLAYTIGDRVLLETDILGQESGRGRVHAITTGSGLVTGLVLDEERDFTLADAEGADRGVAMRLTDGTIRYEMVTDDDTDLTAVTFATPFAMPTDGGDDLIVEGTLVVTGSLGREARHALIWDLAPGPDVTAQITAIDYALSGIFGLWLNEDGSVVLNEDGTKVVLEELT